MGKCPPGGDEFKNVVRARRFRDRPLADDTAVCQWHTHAPASLASSGYKFLNPRPKPRKTSCMNPVDAPAVFPALSPDAVLVAALGHALKPMTFPQLRKALKWPDERI